jgi:hypothetical protein
MKRVEQGDDRGATNTSRTCMPPAHMSRPRISDALVAMACSVPGAALAGRRGVLGLEITCVCLVCKRLLALCHVEVAVPLQQRHGRVVVSGRALGGCRNKHNTLIDHTLISLKTGPSPPRISCNPKNHRRRAQATAEICAGNTIAEISRQTWPASS